MVFLFQTVGIWAKPTLNMGGTWSTMEQKTSLGFFRATVSFVMLSILQKTNKVGIMGTSSVHFNMLIPCDWDVHVTGQF